MDQKHLALPRPPAAGREPTDDGRLVERLRQGDAGAGHRFVREYYPGVYRYLLYLTGRTEMAEDLTQETFLQAWRSLETFTDGAPLRPWLHRIAHRELLQTLRARRSEASLDEVAEPCEPSAANLTDAVELRALLEKLPIEEREMVVLHYLEGYQYREIARITGAPVGRVRQRLFEARERLRRELGEGDLIYLNEPLAPMRQWAWLPLDQMHALETRLTRGGVGRWALGVRTDGRTTNARRPPASPVPAPNAGSEATTEETMERREFLRQAAVSAAGMMLSETEKEIVDNRLMHKVTCGFKGTALSDLCDQLRRDNNVQIAAGPSVADEKVTLFCEKVPLREVMRQLSRSFGYTWLRSGTSGQYRYELVQDLRSQLLEEELRNRDRNEALLALEREIERYRPYLDLSPGEARARAKTVAPADRELLETLGSYGWGPLHLYFRLTPQEQAALRAGQELNFSQEPGAQPTEQGWSMPLPPELARGVLETMDGWRLFKRSGVFSATSAAGAAGEFVDALPPASVPEARATASLKLEQSELGQFALVGRSGYFASALPGSRPVDNWQDGSVSLAAGRSTAALQPDNAVVNAKLASHPALQSRVTIGPVAGGQWFVGRENPDRPLTTNHQPPTTDHKVTSADVLEAIHRATGMLVVADFYTRLYPQEVVSVQDQPLFTALNQLSDAMRLRWHWEGSGPETATPRSARNEWGWLQFRSISFYDDRLKEVPNRRLARWAESRRQNGALTLDDLVEIAGLPDAQLDAKEMAEGATEIWGLEEWELACSRNRRPHLRYLASLTPAQRQEAIGPSGLLFTRMTLAQQQQFLALGVSAADTGLRSPEELEGATLRVDYSLPGWFEWRPEGQGWFQWVLPTGQGGRVPRPAVRERTRAAALEAARRRFAPVAAAMVKAARFLSPQATEAQLAPQEAQIVPTTLGLQIIYVPGASHRHLLVVVDGSESHYRATWDQ